MSDMRRGFDNATIQRILDSGRIVKREIIGYRQNEFVAIVLTLACAGGGIVVAKPPLISSIVTAECYSLAYSDPVKNISASLLPAWIELLPGADSASVVGRPHPPIGEYTWWKRIRGDSIEVNFSGNYEALQIHVQRVGSQLTGRATYLSDVITGGPDPSMRVEATRETCPTPQPASTND